MIKTIPPVIKQGDIPISQHLALSSCSICSGLFFFTSRGGRYYAAFLPGAASQSN
jgi:hypothetical protein